jgi:uncharacterized protein (DUF1501 family)
MSYDRKPPVLVVVQLTGGNDFMNTIIPYASSEYHDSRPTVGIKEDQVIPIDDILGFHPDAAPLKELYDQGAVAIVQGIGYPNSSRSHFRAMDIWHTCNPDRVGTEGWLAQAVQEMDPQRENVLTCVNLGRGLPRALVAPGVPITSVGSLDTYGAMSGIEEERQRNEALRVFKDMYAPAVGAGVVNEYLNQTGNDLLKGADMLKKAPATYSSEVEYSDNPVANSLRDAAKVHLADLGTRVFYVEHGGYDTHANEVPNHPKLMNELSGAIVDFFSDLRDHDASDEVVMMVFSEFGRRIRDNGSGTDHGSGGGAFIIGEPVNGGLYAEYPPLASDQWLNGEDLQHTIDFRGVYGTVLEQWLSIEASPIVGSPYEQIQPFK